MIKLNPFTIVQVLAMYTCLFILLFKRPTNLKEKSAIHGGSEDLNDVCLSCPDGIHFQFFPQEGLNTCSILGI